MKLYVVNESTVVSDAELASWLPAFKVYVNHVRAYWPRPTTLEVAAKGAIPDDGWTLLLLDDADQAGALGYHDYTPGGKPISKCFCKTDQQAGYSQTVTITHELAEMMVDPWISELFQVSDTQLYAKEVGDPVEADEFGYHISAGGQQPVLVSDFVTPAWFIPGHPGPVYDHAKHCTAPLQILAGGYMSVFVSGRGWTQITHDGAEVPMDEKGPASRPARYARPR